MKKIFIAALTICILFSCKKDNNTPPAPPVPGALNYVGTTINDTIYKNTTLYNVGRTAIIKVSFSAPINTSTVASAVSVTATGSGIIAANYTYSNNDSTIVIQPASILNSLTGYTITISDLLKSTGDSALKSTIKITFATALDSTNKFPMISDSALLTLVEQQTFKYFYDFGHPVSGLARERNSSGDIVTIGGSGFGVMSMIVGVQRGFISRADGLARLNLIVNFLITKAQRYHGAFPHWMNGATGATVPFSSQDDGADLVETSYMMQGLLTARQFFNTSDPSEVALRDSINSIWNGVEWNWFRQNGQNVLYWHWSPDFFFAINQQINGWDEAMIVYALAASSPIDSNRIPKIVYDNGWAQNGGIKNGGSYYGITLPLGPAYGGPLFFAHYSFLGINPNNLVDAYANYWTQNQNHSLINYSYCVANPHHYSGYDSNSWGLTASDDNISGYSAHSPTNDLGVISPTAAISSMPYTPTESLNALHFFYYTLGDKLFGPYGFYDAYNLTNVWFATSTLAIDQGPQIVMIENYRTGLLWNLFMSCPEIKTGMTSLGFTSPNL